MKRLFVITVSTLNVSLPKQTYCMNFPNNTSKVTIEYRNDTSSLRSTSTMSSDSDEEYQYNLPILEKYYSEELAQENNKVWADLENIGITRKAHEKFRKSITPQYQKKYFNIHELIELKPSTIQLVKAIIEAYGKNTKNVLIHGVSDDVTSLAAIMTKDLFINELRFLHLTKKAQIFVIVHELQHMKYEDTLNRYALEHMLGTTSQETVKKLHKNHPLLKYYRFTEQRADIYAALQSEELAADFVAFAKELTLLELGYKYYTTHPTNTQRLLLANAIHEKKKVSLSSLQKKATILKPTIVAVL